MRKLLLSAALAMLPCACLHDGAEPPKEAWQGIVLAGCGPADGSQLDFLIDSLPMDCDAPRYDAIRVSVPGLRFDSLRVGSGYGITDWADCADKCVSTMVATRVEIAGLDAKGASVKFLRIRQEGTSAPDTLKGSTRLKLCRETPPPWCG